MVAPYSPSSASYAARIAFVVELAERLHGYGTTAQRLEGALVQVSQQLGLECEPWSNPTGIFLSFSDPKRPLGESDTTRLIRLVPGDTDLCHMPDEYMEVDKMMLSARILARAICELAGEGEKE